MAARALLFDLDGTLWDSWPWYAEAVGADESGVVLSRLRAGDSIVTVALECGLNRAAFAARCAAGMERLRLYADVPSTLEQLAAVGTPMGVVTNLPAWLVQPMLDGSHLARHFTVVVCAAAKPRPAKLAAAAVALTGADRSTFYVGDMAHDALAAANAGLSFAWASYGYASHPPTNMDASLKSITEVLEL